MTSANDRFDRLQRALAAFVAFREEPGGRTDADLLAAHPDLRELLEPMLRGDDEVPRDDDDERPNVTAGMRLGDYALVRELGRGGMGVVFEARQTSLGRRVALKVLHDRLATTPGAVARFRREASAAAALRHPGIAPIYEVGEHDGVHFLAMDFVVGRPLDAVVRDGSLGPPDGAARCRRAAEILADIADALGHAHARGITHLDVKPHNVLLLDDGSVRVVDFGLARDLSWDGDATRRTGVVGTPQYMSPEQARGDPELGPTSDVFSCGLVLCELVSGRRVVAAESVSATLDRVAAAQIAIPHQTARALPRPLRAITERCLAPDAARRYPDGGALAAELRAWLAHRPVAAAAPGLPTRAALSLRRRPVLAAAGLVVALAAGAVAVQRALYEHRVEHAERAGRDGQAGADAATVAALRQLVGVLDDRLARQQQLDEGYRSQLDDAAALAMAQLDRPGADDRFRRQVASALLDAAEVHRRVGDPGAAEPLIAAVLTRIDGAGFVVARARSLQAELA
ncbi:MAG: serine/threonine protein kinase, partial [Planctomycetes bacterium]|nr:serine/threonine protein kinase [Planctomycetota bacterium]